METSTKKKLIVWSGGMDSTSLVLKCYREKISFDTIYFSLKNNVKKTECELYKRDEMKNFLKLSSDTKIYQDIYGTELLVSNHTIDAGYQYLIWLFCLFSSFRQESFNNYDEIWFGYISGDDFWHKKSEFLNICNEYCKCFSIENLPKIKFPIEWETKESLYHLYQMDNVGKELFKMIWTCENPIISKIEIQEFPFMKDIPGRLTYLSTKDYQKCGHCLPCQNFKKLEEYIARNMSEKDCEFVKCANQLKQTVDLIN